MLICVAYILAGMLICATYILAGTKWFGNLVTTKWWDDLFLNEAMATYIAHTYILPKAEPTWNMVGRA